MVNKVDRQGAGIVVVVLQKDPTSKYGRGKSWSLDFADFGITLDYNRLTILKCKPNGTMDNKMWGFDIVKYGSRFSNIREIMKCNKCNGYGKSFGKACQTCNGTGYRDKEDYQHEVSVPKATPVIAKGKV
jgi:hypothetical protein